MCSTLKFEAPMLTVNHPNLQYIKYTVKTSKLSLIETTFKKYSERQVRGRRHRKNQYWAKQHRKGQCRER